MNVCETCGAQFDTAIGLGVHFSHGNCGNLEELGASQPENKDLEACVRAIGNHARRLYALEVDRGTLQVDAQPVFQSLVELMEEILVDQLDWTPEELQAWVRQSNETPQ